MNSEEEHRIEQSLRLLAEEIVRPSRAFKARLVRLLKEALRQQSERPALWRATWFRFALAGLLLAIGLFAWLNRRPAVALLTVREGKAVVQWQRTILFIPQKGEVNVLSSETYPLAYGDRILLAEQGSGVIAFKDGNVIEMDGATDLEIARDASTTRLELRAGDVWAHVVHFLDGEEHFEIRTPVAVVSVRGTIFRTRVQREDAAYSATDEGVTRVTLLDPAQGNPSVEVPAGYEVQAELGKPLQVRPQKPEIATLIVAGQPTSLTHTIAAADDMLEISGRTDPEVTVLLLAFPEERVITRTVSQADGTFTLTFQPPAEGTYPLCVAVEDEEGRRSECVELTYHYDLTPPAVLRLTAPASPAIDAEKTTIQGETESGVQLTLNGTPVPVDEDGHFSIEVSLRHGNNPFHLESCDAAGNCTTLDFTLTRP